MKMNSLLVFSEVVLQRHPYDLYSIIVLAFS